jgi:hypothetical protein
MRDGSGCSLSCRGFKISAQISFLLWKLRGLSTRNIHLSGESPEAVSEQCSGPAKRSIHNNAALVCAFDSLRLVMDVVQRHLILSSLVPSAFFGNPYLRTWISEPRDDQVRKQPVQARPESFRSAGSAQQLQSRLAGHPSLSARRH